MVVPKMESCEAMESCRRFGQSRWSCGFCMGMRLWLSFRVGEMGLRVFRHGRGWAGVELRTVIASGTMKPTNVRSRQLPAPGSSAG